MDNLNNNNNNIHHNNNHNNHNNQNNYNNNTNNNNNNNPNSTRQFRVTQPTGKKVIGNQAIVVFYLLPSDCYFPYLLVHRPSESSRRGY